jgi:hypothetical protein
VLSVAIDHATSATLSALDDRVERRSAVVAVPVLDDGLGR